MKEKLKKYGPAIAIGILAILAYIWYKRHAASSSTDTSTADQASQASAQQAALQGALGGVGGGGGSTLQAPAQSVGGDASVVQPGTSASGLPSNSPQVLAYTSPAPFAIPGTDNSSAAASVPSGPGGYQNPATTVANLPASWVNINPNDPANALNNTPTNSDIFKALPTPDNPYLSTPGFMAGQAAIEKQACADDPTGQACLVSKATDPNFTGGYTTASGILLAANVCEQNQFNQNVFGAQANPNCAGPTPNQALVSQTVNLYGGLNGPTAPTVTDPSKPAPVPKPYTGTLLPGQGFLGQTSTNPSTSTNPVRNGGTGAAIVPPGAITNPLPTMIPVDLGGGPPIGNSTPPLLGNLTTVTTTRPRPSLGSR